MEYVFVFSHPKCDETVQLPPVPPPPPPDSFWSSLRSTLKRKGPPILLNPLNFLNLIFTLVN